MGGADYRGRIRVDGTELRDIAPESLYAVMSVIQQNVFVFNASIRENVIACSANFPRIGAGGRRCGARISDALTQAARRGLSLCGENGSGPLRRRKAARGRSPGAC